MSNLWILTLVLKIRLSRESSLIKKNLSPNPHNLNIIVIKNLINIDNLISTNTIIEKWHQIDKLLEETIIQYLEMQIEILKQHMVKGIILLRWQRQFSKKEKEQKYFCNNDNTIQVSLQIIILQREMMKAKRKAWMILIKITT